jgi:hypothetical protein
MYQLVGPGEYRDERPLPRSRQSNVTFNEYLMDSHSLRLRRR